MRATHHPLLPLLTFALLGACSRVDSDDVARTTGRTQAEVAAAQDNDTTRTAYPSSATPDVGADVVATPATGTSNDGTMPAGAMDTQSHDMSGMDSATTLHPDMGEMATTAPKPATNAADQGFQRVQNQMQTGMQMPLTGDTEEDFLALMIAHHQSGVDMARVALQHSNDAHVKSLAQRIVSEQEKEIKELKNLQTQQIASTTR